MLKILKIGVEHNSAGRAPAPCVEATVLPAGDPGSNPAPSGLILHVIPPSLSLCTIKAKSPKNILKKKLSSA